MPLDLRNIKIAVGSLSRALKAAGGSAAPEQAEVIRAGVIQNFKVTYELCCKFMKRWPAYKFPAVEGVLIDSATLKPIENVLAGCVYRKEIGFLFDNVLKSFKYVCKKERNYCLTAETIIFDSKRQ